MRMAAGIERQESIPSRRDRNGKLRMGSGLCIECGTFRRFLHGDHIVPKYAGGKDEESNIQPLCANCHEDKTEQDRTTYGNPKHW